MSAYADLVLATPGLVSLWELEDTGSPAVDSKGTNNLTSTLGTTYGVAGPFVDGSAVKFDGTTNNLKVANNATFNVADVVTIEALVRQVIPWSTTVNRGILSKGNGAFYLRLGSNGRIQLIKSQIANIVDSTVVVPDTNWHHVAGTKSGAAVHLYLDGIDVTGTVTNSTLVNTTNDLTLGSDSDAANLVQDRGDLNLSNVALYNVALDPFTIAAHAGVSGLSVPRFSPHRMPQGV